MRRSTHVGGAGLILARKSDTLAGISNLIAPAWCFMPVPSRILNVAIPWQSTWQFKDNFLKMMHVLSISFHKCGMTGIGWTTAFLVFSGTCGLPDPGSNALEASLDLQRRMALNATGLERFVQNVTIHQDGRSAPYGLLWHLSPSRAY